MKIFATLFISILSLSSVLACGGGWYYADYNNIYRIDYMLAEGALGETYHNYSTPFIGDAVTDNLQEWKAYFENKYSRELLAGLIYTEDDNADVYKIESSLKSSNYQKRELFKDYMVLAKKAEQISTANDPWSYYRSDEVQVNFGLINKLTKDIIAKIKTVDDPFIKERYNFQLTKLYYYGERYDKAIEAHDSYYGNLYSKSIMYYWGLDYKAGAQMQNGDVIEANYNFLKVFDSYPGRRSKSYYSMVFSDEEQFSNTLDLCRNDAEKAAFHFVRGVNKNSVVLEDLKSCFNYAPNSEYAQTLMANELVKMEHIFWNKEDGQSQWDSDVESMPMEQLVSYIEDFIAFADGAVKKADDKIFWKISLAYLYSLHGEYEESENIINQLNPSQEGYNNQMASIHLLNYIFQHPKLGQKEENELGEMWFAYNKGSGQLDKNTWGSDGSINSFLADYLEGYYKEIDPVKSFLFSGQTFSNFRWEYNEKLDVDEIHELRMQLNKSEKTSLQKYGEASFLAGSGEENINDGMMEVEATLLMRDPKTLDKALALFEKLSETKKIQTNPFNMDIRDCIRGGWMDENSCGHKPGVYTKLSLAKKLLEMKKLAEKNNSAMDYYLLGNAYYNMTYFGHAFDALSYFRSGSSYTGFNDCSAALEMYEKAIPLFKDNREMQAKTMFMAAKCEQNLYFIDLDNTSEYGYWGIDVDYKNPEQDIIDYNAQISDAGFREHFDVLKNEYSDTKFYQQIIEECSYFDLYVHY